MARKARDKDGGLRPEGLVKHPPEDRYSESDWHDLRLCTTVSRVTAERGDISLLKLFPGDPNPVLLIEAFCIAHEAKLFPPMWVLDRLATAFERWHKLQGLSTVDDCLGLSPKKFKALISDQRDELVMNDIARLVALGLKPEQAATLATARLRRERWNNSPYKKLGNISAATALDRWRKRWRSVFGLFQDHWLKSTTDPQRTEFLKIFPGALQAQAENRSRIKSRVRKTKNRTLNPRKK